MESRRKAIATLVSYLALVGSILFAAAPATAASNLDVIIYDAASCSGTSFGITHEYSNLGTIGWNDRLSAIKFLSSGLGGYIHRDDNWAGEQKHFNSGSQDCNLTDNHMAYWLGQDLSWSNQVTSISHD